MQRYFCNIDKDEFILSSDDSYHITKVMRYGIGTNIEVVSNEVLYPFKMIGLTTSRDELYNRINNRVDEMLKEGLINEARSLYNQNIHSKAINTGIGYKELYKYFDGDISLDEALDLIKKNSRHYAKRQYTFFNHQFPITWFDVDYNNFSNTIEDVYNFIKE